MMKSFSSSTVLLMALFASVARVDAGTSSHHAGQVLHICNRGFCYNKREEPLNPSTWHLTQLAAPKRKIRHAMRGIDFCMPSSEGGSEFVDCELFSILGAESVDREFEALECIKGMDCGVKEEPAVKKEQPSVSTYTVIDGEVIELDEAIPHGHVSWKERPQKGKCYDSELGYEFECNLVEIIDEGMVLIEDLRLGGVFAAQPKTNFTTRRGKQKRAKMSKTAPSPPSVVISEDPLEDLRTVRAMNMEGF